MEIDELADLAAKTVLALGIGLLAGSVWDLIRNRVTQPAAEDDFSLSAMRDRRARKRNPYFFRWAAACLAGGALALLLLGLLTA
jgi:hypothetical protein